MPRLRSAEPHTVSYRVACKPRYQVCFSGRPVTVTGNNLPARPLGFTRTLSVSVPRCLFGLRFVISLNASTGSPAQPPFVFDGTVSV